MAEEHRCEAPEGHHLCANNCGFFGSPATMNLCSKCYRDFCLKEQQQASIKSTVEASLSASAADAASSSLSAPPCSPPSTSLPSSPAAIETLCQPPPPALTLPEAAGDIIGEPAEVVRAPEVVATVVSQPNRCTVCRKRVGLTGFKCRCGTTFCGVHRYPEKHACSFDFKTLGREEIARSNPLVISPEAREDLIRAVGSQHLCQNSNR